MLKPILTTKSTSCSCGGNEAWFIEFPEGDEMCIRCTCCGPKPNLSDIEQYVHKYRRGALDTIELFFRSEQKDVIEERALVDDEMLHRMKEHIREGGRLKAGDGFNLIGEIERLRLELADFEMLCRHTSVIYDWASGGRISKPTTLPEEVMTQGDDRINEMVRESVQEATVGFKKVFLALRDYLSILLTNPFASIGNSGLTTLMIDQISDAIQQLPPVIYKEKKWYLSAPETIDCDEKPKP